MSGERPCPDREAGKQQNRWRAWDRQIMRID
jgi:hypothetical protein